MPGVEISQAVMFLGGGASGRATFVGENPAPTAQAATAYTCSKAQMRVVGKRADTYVRYKFDVLLVVVAGVVYTHPWLCQSQCVLHLLTAYKVWGR